MANWGSGGYARLDEASEHDGARPGSGLGMSGAGTGLSDAPYTFGGSAGAQATGMGAASVAVSMPPSTASTGGAGLGAGSGGATTGFGGGGGGGGGSGAGPAAGVSGTIGAPQSSEGSTIGNTLDEPVSVTIMRDLTNIWNKVRQVLAPSKSDKNILRDWDWWGPLLFCLALSVRLSITARSDQGPTVFSATFFIIWFGSAVVTLNAKLLGGTISFFQSVCVLGYCVFPLVAVSLVTWLIPFVIKFVLVAAAFVWSSYASLNFMGDVNLESKRLLAIYPIFLFYITIAWLILIAV
ncbi:hypothetical protein HK105_202436 [Polyrhizophydium stewartii]|uniref:Protein YIP n=1 Tax=Polyrhizophydium stewartii TaxID=2732419 RepID=A0ABR4NES8_9FUNG|nr:Yip1 member 6 [Polyrhizophydium stewartii]